MLKNFFFFFEIQRPPPPYNPLKSKCQKWFFGIQPTPFRISSFWDNLMPSYVKKKHIYDICIPKGEKGMEFPKIFLSWGQGLKTNLNTKIHDSVYHRITGPCWIREWVSGHTFLCKFHLFKLLSALGKFISQHSINYKSGTSGFIYALSIIWTVKLTKYE